MGRYAPTEGEVIRDVGLRAWHGRADTPKLPSLPKTVPENTRDTMLLQGSARTFVLATAVLLALASHAPEARAQPTRVPGPVVDASRVAAERGGARLERAQCERTYRVNPPSHCYVQAFGRDGGAVEILSDEPDSRRGERLVLELQSGISVPAQNALLYEPRTRRLFVGDGMSIRVFDFERLEWRFVVACRAPVVAPDQTSIACLGMRGELVRVPASSDEGPWTVFAPEEPVRILARHRDWLEGHPCGSPCDAV